MNFYNIVELYIVLNLAFALSVLGFLIMHISLVAGNTTTIEVNFGTPFLSPLSTYNKLLNWRKEKLQTSVISLKI